MDEGYTCTSQVASLVKGHGTTLKAFACSYGTQTGQSLSDGSGQLGPTVRGGSKGTGQTGLDQT